MHAIHVTLTVVFSALLLTAGPLRVIGTRLFRSNCEKLRVPYRLFRFMGLVEIICGVTLLVGLRAESFAVAAAMLVVLESIFSVALHIRINEPLARVAIYTPTIAAGAALLISALHPMIQWTSS